MRTVHPATVASVSSADALAAAILGFALGLGVHGGAPQLLWLWWLVLGQ